jgi:SPP1 family predicted phage head-tail adaptor
MAIDSCKTNNFLCIGDLDKYITLQKRELKPPRNTDFDEVMLFTNIAEVWSAVKTVSSKFPFDSAEINIDESITHKFYIRYREDILINYGILFDNKRYKILSIKDIDFEKKWLELNCNFKGSASEEAAKW